nr:universal stress protein [Haloterrigena gelatinilytica]
MTVGSRSSTPFPLGYGSNAFRGTAVERIVETETERGNAVLDSGLDAVGDDDTVVGTRVVYGTPAQSIVEYATRNEFDQPVAGSHGRSLPTQVVLGSVAETVVRRSRDAQTSRDPVPDRDFRRPRITPVLPSGRGRCGGARARPLRSLRSRWFA